METVNRLVESAEALQLTLHGQRVGILTHYTGGKNILTFDPEYKATREPNRPTMTLTQRINPDYLDKELVSSQRVPAVLSNLLPEGALRELLSEALRIHPANEFPLLAWVGNNLPGAIIASPVPAGEIPGWALSARNRIEAVQIDVKGVAQKFSLAGIQMKFSTVRRDGRYNISIEAGTDDWIVKTPSTLHRNVPENEYSAMKLAESAGVHIPEVDLISLDTLDNLPAIQLPNETHAYAIRRFDRSALERIHTEDFAQVFEFFAHDKYKKANYEQVANALYRYGAGGLADIQQMARRLLANILLANGDAHLKNWTLIYPDAVNPGLAPAYDIVSTLPYVPSETGIALNLGKQKKWHSMNLETFQTWSNRLDVPWPAIKVHLLDALAAARDLWPGMLQDLPMHEPHKKVLRSHWTKLSADFKLL